MSKITKEVKIVNKLGLHARASAKLTQTASRFQAKVMIAREQKEVNAKSIMGVMMLAAPMDSVIRFSAEGEDANAAITALVDLVNSKFGEDE